MRCYSRPPEMLFSNSWPYLPLASASEDTLFCARSSADPGSIVPWAGPRCKTPCCGRQGAPYIREVAMLSRVRAAHAPESMSCFPAESMFCFAAPVGHALITIVCHKYA